MTDSEFQTKVLGSLDEIKRDISHMAQRAAVHEERTSGYGVRLDGVDSRMEKERERVDAAHEAVRAGAAAGRRALETELRNELEAANKRVLALENTASRLEGALFAMKLVIGGTGTVAAANGVAMLSQLFGGS